MADIPAAPTNGDQPPAKAGPKAVVLVGAMVGGLIIGGAAGMLAVGPMVARSSGYADVPAGAAPAEPEAAAAEHSAGGEAAPAAEGGEGGGGEGAASNVHVVDNLVLNPAQSGGSRFLMLATAIELAEAPQVEELKARDAEVRDVILRVVGARTVEELAEMATRDTLKQVLSDSLGTLFKSKKAVRRIYFPQFVIQ